MKWERFGIVFCQSDLQSKGCRFSYAKQGKTLHELKEKMGGKEYEA